MSACDCPVDFGAGSKNTTFSIDIRAILSSRHLILKSKSELSDIPYNCRHNPYRLRHFSEITSILAEEPVIGQIL